MDAPVADSLVYGRAKTAGALHVQLDRLFWRRERSGRACRIAAYLGRTPINRSLRILSRTRSCSANTVPGDQLGGRSYVCTLRDSDCYFTGIPAGQCGTPKAGAYLDRCGYGPRQPLLVISPYARSNFVDHTITDQSSILRFIEDNWGLGRIGNQSFDAEAGPLTSLFDFGHAQSHKLFLDPTTGEPTE